MRQILASVGLAHKGGQRALDLSSGETKRLGLARAMVLAPEILSWTNPPPTSIRRNTEIIEDIILRMKAGRGATILMITTTRPKRTGWGMNSSI